MGKKKKTKKIKTVSETKKDIRSSVAEEQNQPSDPEIVLKLPKWFRSETFIYILFSILAFTLYSLSLGNEFVWDDVEVITKSYYNFKDSSILSKFIPTSLETKKLLYYRPTIPISYIVDWNNWKLNPFGYHLSNSIFYSLAVVSMFFLSRRLASVFKFKQPVLFSLLATLLFTIHPMHVESVSWIAGRTDVLCTMFFLFALGFHVLSYKKIYLLPVVCLFYLFSLFSKEVAVAFPFIVVCVDLIVKRPLNKKDIIKYFIYFGILALYLYLRSRAFINVPSVYNPDIVTSGGGSGDVLFYFRFLKVLFVTYAYYLKQLIFPYTFNAFITYLPTSALYLTVSVTLVSIMVFFFFYSLRKKKNFVAINIFWIFLTLGPSVLIAIFGFIATPVAERYLFLPSVGYCLLVAYLLSIFIERPKIRNFALGLGAVLIVSYLYFSVNRQQVWQNRINFWEDASAKSDRHAIPHINYGMALLDNGRIDEAISEFHISLKPDIENTPTGRAIAANNLGVAYINKNNYVDAAKALLIALESDPSFYKTYYHFGLLYYIKAGKSKLQEDYLASEKYLLQATNIYSRYGKAFLLLAKLNSNFGYKAKAISNAQMALKSGLVDELASQATEILKLNQQ